MDSEIDFGTGPDRTGPDLRALAPRRALVSPLSHLLGPFLTSIADLHPRSVEVRFVSSPSLFLALLLKRTDIGN